MATFITELWESVFTPGTTPTLILATHVTFAFLVTTLSIFVFLSKSIHLINLLVISLLLWGTLTWFISELDKVKENEQNAEGNKKDAPETTTKSTSSASTTSSEKPVAKPRKSKKI